MTRILTNYPDLRLTIPSEEKKRNSPNCYQSSYRSGTPAHAKRKPETSRADMDVQMIDTRLSMKAFLDDLPNCVGPESSLYIDLEGNNLSRHGTLSLITVLVEPRHTTHLVDVTSLGNEAFTIAGSDGRTLKTILESPEIVKVFFRYTQRLQRALRHLRHPPRRNRGFAADGARFQEPFQENRQRTSQVHRKGCSPTGRREDAVVNMPQLYAKGCLL